MGTAVAVIVAVGKGVVVDGRVAVGGCGVGEAGTGVGGGGITAVATTVGSTWGVPDETRMQPTKNMKAAMNREIFFMDFDSLS